MTTAFHDTVTAASAVTSLYCSCERMGVYVHALGERDVITTSLCVDVRHNALFLRGLVSVDMLAVALSPRPALVKAITVKIYTVPNSRLC